jgi:hypothetical protein
MTSRRTAPKPAQPSEAPTQNGSAGPSGAPTSNGSADPGEAPAANGSAEPTDDPTANGAAGPRSDRPFAPIQAALLDLVGAARLLLDATEQALADPATFEQVSGVVTGLAHRAFDLVGPFLRQSTSDAAPSPAAGADARPVDDAQPARPPRSDPPKGFEHIDLG